MSNDSHRDSLDALHLRIATSSDSQHWMSAAAEKPDWQREVLARLYALTSHDEIHYLSSARLESGDWDFVAFTQNRVVRVTVADAGSDRARFETVTFPRGSLESIELLDVDSVGLDDPWPADLNLIGHYRVGSIPLPLDKFASESNRGDLTVLLRSLLDDLAHR